MASTPRHALRDCRRPNWLLDRPLGGRPPFFRRSHLQRAHNFYEKYGGRAVILARFIPIVRTFCPPVAGAAKMPYARYLLFDICGGILWVGAMILGGYALGSSAT